MKIFEISDIVLKSSEKGKEPDVCDNINWCTCICILQILVLRINVTCVQSITVRLLGLRYVDSTYRYACIVHYVLTLLGYSWIAR